MMTKLAAAVLFSLVASCAQWMQLKHVCDLDVDGICVSLGDVELTGECMSDAIDIAYHRYSLQYGIDFNTRELAEDSNLYLAWRSDDFVKAWCGPGAAGCYSRTTGEIVIANTKNDDVTIVARGDNEMLGSLAHEMFHFWNHAVLRHRQPALFFPFFQETEATHQAPNMFSIWCEEHCKDIDEGEVCKFVCVEDVVRAEILASDCGRA